MNLRSKVASAVIGLSLSGLSVAGPYTEKLSKCFAESTNGKDRKQFGRLMYVALASHPEMGQNPPPSDGVKDEMARGTAEVVTRLLTESCSNEAREAVEHEGSAGLMGAFGILGQLAMQEMMTSPEVTSTLGAFEKYIDREKLQKVLSSK